MSRDLPIIVNGPSVRAILADAKTQTRRLIRFRQVPDDPDCHDVWRCWRGGDSRHPLKPGEPTHQWQDGDERIACPWEPGDRLWVKEAWALVPATAYRQSVGVQQTVCPHDLDMAAVYRAGWDRCRPGRWRPSIHMPRWASRLTLEVLAVRAERLQDISEADAAAEGIERPHAAYSDVDYYQAWVGRTCATNESARVVYRALWDSLHAARGHGWDLNEWVWVVTFRRLP